MSKELTRSEKSFKHLSDTYECAKCRFVDQKALKENVACCTFPYKLDLRGTTCFSYDVKL